MSIKKMPPIATTYFLLFSVDKYVTKGRKKDSGPAFQRFLRKFIFHPPQNTTSSSPNCGCLESNYPVTLACLSNKNRQSVYPMASKVAIWPF